jgi:hypothetical protein
MFIDCELSTVSWWSTPPLPHLWELWTLEDPVGALVHKTTYSPNTSLGPTFALVMDLHASKTLHTGPYKS